MLAVAPQIEHAPSVAVRLADQRDEEGLISMCRQLHMESALRDATGRPLPIDEEKVRHCVQRAIVPNRNSGEAQAWIGVIGDYGALQGSVYLSVEMPWYTSQAVIHEWWNYCLPEYRQSNNARALIDFAKASADAMGASLVMGIMTAGREEAKARFYRRQLGNPIGSFFAYTGSNKRGRL